MKCFNYNGELCFPIYTDFKEGIPFYYIRLYTEGDNHGVPLSGEFETKEKAEEYIIKIKEILNL